MKYAELDGILFRAQDDFFFSQKLVGGQWVGNHDMARVRSFGMPIDEDEAREIAGDQWPKAEKPEAEPA